MSACGARPAARTSAGPTAGRPCSAACARRASRAEDAAARQAEPFAELACGAGARRFERVPPEVAALVGSRHRHLKRDRSGGGLAGDGAVAARDDRDRAVVALQPRQLARLAEPAIEPDNRHRVQQRGEHAGRRPAIVGLAQWSRELERAAPQRAHDRARDRPAAVVSRSADDDGLRLPGTEHGRERLDLAPRVVSKHQLVEPRQLVRGREGHGRDRRDGRFPPQRVPYGWRTLEHPLQARRLGVHDVHQAVLEEDAKRAADARDAVLIAPPRRQQAERRSRGRAGLGALDEKREARVFLGQTDRHEQRQRTIVEAERLAQRPQRQMRVDAAFPASDELQPSRWCCCRGADVDTA